MSRCPQKGAIRSISTITFKATLRPVELSGLAEKSALFSCSKALFSMLAVLDYINKCNMLFLSTIYFWNESAGLRFGDGLHIVSPNVPFPEDMISLRDSVFEVGLVKG